MADNAQGSSSQSYWEGYKEFWSERFSFLGNYSKFIKRDKPIPSWSSSDVEEFMASDPVHGPVLRSAREAVQFGLTGSALGALFTAGYAWKYSRSLHGAGLSFLAGGIFGWTFGHEIANHALQLYRVDTLAAEVKFLEWWNKKTGGLRFETNASSRNKLRLVPFFLCIVLFFISLVFLMVGLEVIRAGIFILFHPRTIETSYSKSSYSA